MINPTTGRTWTVYSIREERKGGWAVLATTWAPDGPIEESEAVVGRATSEYAAQQDAEARQRDYDYMRNAAVTASLEASA